MAEMSEPIWRYKSTVMRPQDLAREFLREAFEEPRTLCDFKGFKDNQGGSFWTFGTQESEATWALSGDAEGNWSVAIS